MRKIFNLSFNISKRDLPSTTFDNKLLQKLKTIKQMIGIKPFKAGKSGAGFTLMEILVVLVIAMTVGVIVLSILFSSFRLTNKVNTLNTVRQNGNHAISQMAKMLRDAKSLDPSTSCIGSPQTSLTFTSLDEGQTRFDCSSGSTISSNSASLLDTTAVSLVPNACSFTCSQESALDFPTISIKFSLRQVSPPGVTLSVERTATIPFETSVVLRNLRR